MLCPLHAAEMEDSAPMRGTFLMASEMPVGSVRVGVPPWRSCRRRWQRTARGKRCGNRKQEKRQSDRWLGHEKTLPSLCGVG